MRKPAQGLFLICFGFCLLTISACKQKDSSPSVETISALNLKTGQIIACGSPDKRFGTVVFQTSCSEKVKKDFDLGIALMHSFEYEEAEKVFAKIIKQEPECAIAYWGVAMSNYHALWAPPTLAELEKGAKAIAIAQSLTRKSKREADYIDAVAVFYKDWNKSEHRNRSASFEKAMEKLHIKYPDDKEAAIFYALTLTANADPTDKTYSKQKKAVAILNAIYPGEPNHPGIIHYIIHSYDNPELAALALKEARRYASIAPSSAHAQHMPSHIFTRLGLWDESIRSNLAATASALCYAEAAGIKGHWDEELHSVDYLVYGYLQKGNNDSAKKQVDYVNTIKEVSPVNFKVAYMFAAVPSRYVLENKMWKEAASLKIYPANFAWNEYPWQRAIVHFARLLGSVHTGDLDSARHELKNLNSIYDTLIRQKDSYKANQVQIQIKTSEAWISFKEGRNNEALKLMNIAADSEDNTQKHPVTPGEVIPARELLGDMLLEMNKPEEALKAYEADLKSHPNRFNGVYSAALAAEKMGDREKANHYYQQLISIADLKRSDRKELKAARSSLKMN